MRAKKIQGINQYQILRFLTWTFTTKHEYVSYFNPLPRESAEVSICFRPKFLP